MAQVLAALLLAPREPYVLYDKGYKWLYCGTCQHDYDLCRGCRALAWIQCSSLGQKQALSSWRLQRWSRLELRQSRGPSPRMSQP